MTLSLEPGAARCAAELCERAARRLAQHRADLLAVSPPDGGLGECAEGRGWSRLLRESATGEPSLRWLLEHHIAALRSLAEELRGVERRLTAADRCHAAGFAEPR